MKVSDVKDIVDRQPFRRFAVRLSNGAQYAFNEQRDLGVSKDYQMLFYFGPGGGAVRIDTENIVEVFETNGTNGA